MLSFVQAFGRGTELKVLQLSAAKKLLKYCAFCMLFATPNIIFNVLNKPKSNFYWDIGTYCTYLYRPRLNKIGSLLVTELVNA